MNWKSHTISIEKTVRQCFEQINFLSHKFLVVLNKHGGVENTITDGDLRRYIIASGDIDQQLHDLCSSKPTPIIATEAEPRQKLMQILSEKIEFIPIVDKAGELIDIFHRDVTTFRLGPIEASTDGPSVLIAEIGNNHNGSVVRAKKLIDKAIWAGADIVKFQMRQLDDLYVSHDSSNDDLGSQYTRDLLKKYQLTNSEFEDIFDYCRSRDIPALCTPFDMASVDILESMDVPGYKVASADFMNWPLLKRIAETKKPMLISTGMTTEADLRATCDYLNSIYANFVLLHCNSSYPSPFKDVNLAYIDRLKTYSLYPFVGYSGHERGYHIPLAAIAMGARVIEKHFTLDKGLEGNDHKVSLLPEEFRQMVDYARDIEAAIGFLRDRTLTQGEMLNKDVLGKAVTALSDIKIGEAFTHDNLGIKSPGGGAPPNTLEEFFGAVATREISAGDQLFPSDLSSIDHSLSAINFNRPVGIPVRYHDFCALASDKPLDFVEFHFSYSDLELDPDNYFDEQPDIDYVVHAPELFENDHILDLCSFDLEYREKSILNLERTISATKKLNKYFPNTKRPLIVVNVGGWSVDGFLPEETRAEKYELIAESLDRLRGPDHELIIQTMPPFPWHFGGQRFHNLFVDPSEITKFCNRYGYRICLDISHTYLAVNFLDLGWNSAIDALGPISAHLHVVDGAGVDAEGLDIGSGSINFKDLGERLAKVAPDIPFIPEIWQGHKDSGAGFWQALQKLDGLL